MSVANNIKSTLPKTESAKEFMNFSLAGTLMGTLTTMKFNGSRTMYEHVIKMTNIAAKLKSLGMNVDEKFLVQFIINSLPSEYSPFQMKYNTMKDKWNVIKLHNMLVQEETGLKNQRTHYIYLVNDQGARKKTRRKHGKGKSNAFVCFESKLAEVPYNKGRSPMGARTPPRKNVKK
ncbi:hypothetical protein ACOSP7_021608 [Xanthoceras sorbifolium]